MSKLLGIKELCEFWQAIKSYLALKQDKLTAGTNITISGNTISASNAFKTFYATCSTAAGTAAKVATKQGTDAFSLRIGTLVGVRYTNTNTASNPTLNVSNTGAKPIYYNGNVIATSALTVAGYANRIIYYMYDGTNWVFAGWSLDANTWNQNTASANGYVLAGSGHANQVWKTDADGVPAWRNDSNTWQQNTASQNGYVTSGSGHANQVWKTNADGVPGWRADANTTYSNATQTTSGLMSAADKKRFDNIKNNMLINKEIYKANVTIAASSAATIDIGALPTESGFYFGVVNNAYITTELTTSPVGTSWTFINNIWVDYNTNHVYVVVRNFMTAQAKLTIGVRLLYVRNIS